MCPVSKKQEEILEFIKSFQNDQGFSPSVREIASHFGMKSPNGVQYHLDVLEREGLLNREPKTSRGLRMQSVNPQITPIKIPVVGRVAAGGLHLAYEEIEREVYLDPELFGHKENPESLFALRVIGDSMKGAGIYEGDIAVVQRQRSANLGDVVVAMLDGEATLKRYLPRNGYIVLQPENEAYTPIVVKEKRLKDLTILGRVIGLLRTNM